LRWPEIILLSGALPAFIHTTFEGYILTWWYGPQMVLFALFHGGYGSLWGGIVFISFFFYLVLALYAAYVLLRAWLKPGRFAKQKIIFFASVLLVQVVHTSVFATYDTWVYKVFPTTKDEAKNAIYYTEVAIKNGKAGHADVLVKKAEVALKHARAAHDLAYGPYMADAFEYLEEGINHLEAVVASGKKGEAPVATRHAEEALAHLTEAVSSIKSEH
jgi:hypothetical protein